MFDPTVMPVIWAGIIGISVALYVIMDGFDLGVGLLFPFRPEEHDRDVMMNSVAPFWDGNETWLILGGGALWIAFPAAYAIVMPAAYIPVILMLLGLVLRGVAFEFRWVSKPDHALWDLAFAVGSFVAAFMQGVCSARCSAASRSRTSASPAAPSTSSPPSRFCAVSGSSPATRCSAPPGSPCGCRVRWRTSPTRPPSRCSSRCSLSSWR